MTHFMSINLPKAIGHRGAAAYAPENTLESIATAADQGAKWVELDVKLTRDEVPILFHDDILDRTTNGSGAVAETDYADISSLEAGSWFGESFAGIQIPTLEEALEVIILHDLGLNLEIKPCPGREKETAEAALDVLTQIWDEPENILISSFQHVSRETARDVAQDWNRGLLIGGQSPDEIPDNWRELADYLDVKTMNIGSKILTNDFAMDIIDEGYPLLVYTVNQPDEARRMQQMGVDSIITDAPDIILENILTTH